MALKLSKNEEQKVQEPVVDFTRVEITDLTGETNTIDLSQLLGNFIYKTTPDLGMFEAARTIYLEGRVRLTAPVKEGLLLALQEPRCPFTALVKSKLTKMVNAG